MITIGITGGVGCGKSSILSYICEKYKCRIILADDVANKIKEPGEECYEALVNLLGQDILGKDGFINKGAMAAKIFADDSLLDKVNDIIHPAVKRYFLKQKEIEEKSGNIDFLFFEAALLIECGYNEHVDEMWYIYAPEKIRADRLKTSRGYSEEKIAGIMSAQLSEEEFRKGSDFCIDNGGAIEESYRQIDSRIKILLG